MVEFPHCSSLHDEVVAYQNALDSFGADSRNLLRGRG